MSEIHWALSGLAAMSMGHLVLRLAAAAGAGVFVLYVLESLVRHRRSKGRPGETAGRVRPWRFVLYGLVGVAVALLLMRPGGAPKRAFVALDASGRPLRATVEVEVVLGGKVRISHDVARALAGPDGRIVGQRYLGYSSSSTRMRPVGAAVWYTDDDRRLALLELGTLATVADEDAIRAAVPQLRGVESRVERVDATGDVVFQRRDGQLVRVEVAQVVPEGAALAEPGCRVDRDRITSPRSGWAPVEATWIDPRLVPWSAPGPGCPANPAETAMLVLHDDAAFGDVHKLISFVEDGAVRWKHRLDTLLSAEEPELLGAVPLSDRVVLVAADDEDLLIAALARQDGRVVEHWRW
jgi:hypothetical protein